MSTPAPTFRVMVVDDEPVIVDLLTNQLTRAGYLCAKAHNGREALELSHTFHPNLVFMNVVMPVMPGFESAARIVGYHPGCDVIFFSGHAADLPLYECLNRYGYTFPPILPKPVRPEQFLQIAADAAAHQAESH